MELKRPWWKKKRWAALCALWLVVAYPLSIGPSVYAANRNSNYAEVHNILYAPLIATYWLLPPGAQKWYTAYVWWWSGPALPDSPPYG